ncbi:hypothetical protein Tco_1558664, partial [Tanacetum coccineum]
APKPETIKTLSSSVAAGAGEAISEGITGETSGDSRNHSGDDGVLTDDGGVWTGAGEALTVSSSSESVFSSFNSILFVSISVISSEVPMYLFCEGRVDDDVGMIMKKGSCKRIYTFYGTKNVIGPSPRSAWLSSQGDDGEVRSAGGVGEGDEVTLVSQVSKDSDSSSGSSNGSDSVSGAMGE